MITTKVSHNLESASREFPKLMRCNHNCREGDLIVLMTAPGHGVVVSDYPVYAIGHVSSDWDTESFDAFDGFVELSNER